MFQKLAKPHFDIKNTNPIYSLLNTINKTPSNNCKFL